MDRLQGHFEDLNLGDVLAVRLITFPKHAEFRLGYTANGTDRAGSGGRFARRRADGIAVAITAGLPSRRTSR